MNTTSYTHFVIVTTHYNEVYILYIIMAIFAVSLTTVRVAERSKAPDLRSGPLMWAWVRIPFLTTFSFNFLQAYYRCTHYLFLFFTMKSLIQMIRGYRPSHSYHRQLSRPSHSYPVTQLSRPSRSYPGFQFSV